MSGFSVDLSALDACQDTVSSYAGQFGSAGDSLSSAPPAASSFGTLPASKTVAQLSAQLSSAASSQFSAAETFLRATASCLGQVADNYASTEKTNTSNAKGAVQ
jgi:hypothetical protein